MGLTASFEILSRIVERHESHCGDIRQVEVTTGDANEDALHVTIDVPVPLCFTSSDGRQGNLSPEAAALTDDGGLRVEFSPPALAFLSTFDGAVSTGEQAVRVTDGDLHMTVDLTIDPTDGERRSASAGDDPSVGDSTGTDEAADATDRHDDTSKVAPTTSLQAARNEELPPYEDTEYLRQLYETCDTFTEMSREIPMDVSSETVRRYLIEAGIHEPASYETASEDASTGEAGGTDGETADPSSQSPSAPEEPGETLEADQLVTDGHGLPGDVRIDDVVEAVVESKTVYEVQRYLDLDRRRTRDLLDRLDLLDLVMHRVSEEPQRDASYEEVAARIRQGASAGA